MRRIVSRRTQEQEFGELSEHSCRRLHQLAHAFEVDPHSGIPSAPGIKPGIRLVRQWKDQVQVVNVEEKGYQYRGARYESLSEIALLITGTRWSGPLFFGLKRKPSEHAKPVIGIPRYLRKIPCFGPRSPHQ